MIAAAVSPATSPATASLLRESIRVAFVDGRYVPELSDTNLPQGLRITPLASPQRGVLIHVDPHTVIARPIHLSHQSSAESASSGSVDVEHAIVAAAHSQTTVFETHAGRAHATRAVVDISVNAYADLTHITVQRTGPLSDFSGEHRIRQEKGSSYRSHVFSFGGQRSCLEEAIALEDVDTHTFSSGLYLGHDSQRLEHRVHIDHRHPHGTSRTLHKGILDGHSRGIFDGKVTVHPNADKTDASQTSKSLLLSDHAEADPKPHLEIFADDVKCSHGSSVGQIDANALFYLRSRGLNEPEARRLLTYAFASEIMESIQSPPIRAVIESHLREELLAARRTEKVNP